MAIETVHRDAQMRRYYETPPGVPFFARTIGQLYFAASNYFSDLHQDKPRQNKFIDRLHKYRVNGGRLAKWLAKSEEDLELAEDYVINQPSRRKQIQVLVEAAPALLRLKRQDLFERARRKRDLRKAKIAELKEKAEPVRRIAATVAAATFSIFK